MFAVVGLVGYTIISSVNQADNSLHCQAEHLGIQPVTITGFQWFERVGKFDSSLAETSFHSTTPPSMRILVDPNTRHTAIHITTMSVCLALSSSE